MNSIQEWQGTYRQHNRGRRLSLDDAALGRRYQPADEHITLADGKRVLVEARGEVFTIPAERATCAPDQLGRIGGTRSGLVADGKWISYFSDRSGEYRLYVEAQDGLTPPREITLDNPPITTLRLVA